MPVHALDKSVETRSEAQRAQLLSALPPPGNTAAPKPTQSIIPILGGRSTSSSALPVDVYASEGQSHYSVPWSTQAVSLLPPRMDVAQVKNVAVAKLQSIYYMQTMAEDDFDKIKEVKDAWESDRFKKTNDPVEEQKHVAFVTRSLAEQNRTTSDLRESYRDTVAGSKSDDIWAQIEKIESQIEFADREYNMLFLKSAPSHRDVDAIRLERIKDELQERRMELLNKDSELNAQVSISDSEVCEYIRSLPNSQNDPMFQKIIEMFEVNATSEQGASLT